MRTVRTLSQRLHRIARRKGEHGRAALKAALGRLVAAVKRTASQGKRMLRAVQGRTDEPGARRLAEQSAEILPRLRQSIREAERRVLGDDPVPAGKKVLSLSEPHTQVIPLFKAGNPVEFGREPRPDKVEGGLITGYWILEQGGGGPAAAGCRSGEP